MIVFKAGNVSPELRFVGGAESFANATLEDIIPGNAATERLYVITKAAGTPRELFAAGSDLCKWLEQQGAVRKGAGAAGRSQSAPPSRPSFCLRSPHMTALPDRFYLRVGESRIVKVASPTSLAVHSFLFM